MKKQMVISLHDFHPGTHEAVAAQVRDLEALGAGRFSILAVPYFHKGKKLTDHAASMAFLDSRAAKGDDLVLHGYYHECGEGDLKTLFWTNVYTNHEAEFLDLSEGEVAHRVGMGQKIWADRGWPLQGFIAPAWLMPRHQDLILRRMGFLYTTRLRTVHNLQKNFSVHAQSLCYSTRSFWRTGLSLAWNRLLFSRLRRGPLVRLSLHPGDWRSPSVRKQALRIVEMALAEGYQPVTYADYVQM